MALTKGQQYLETTLRTSENPLAKWSRQRKKDNLEEGAVRSESFCLRFSVPNGHWRAFCDAWQFAKDEDVLEVRGRNSWLLGIVKQAIDPIKIGSNDRSIDIGRFDVLIHRKQHSDFLLRMQPSTNLKLSAVATELNVSKNTLLLQILLARFEEILLRHGRSIAKLTPAELQEFASQKASTGRKQLLSQGGESESKSIDTGSPASPAVVTSPSPQDQDISEAIRQLGARKAQLESRVALLRLQVEMKGLEEEVKALTAKLGPTPE